MRNLIILFTFIIFSSLQITAQDFCQQTNGPTGGVVFSIAINSSGDVFAGTWSGGVFRSTNNGVDWVSVNAGLNNNNVKTLEIGSNGFVYIGTQEGFFRSTDNGNSWTQVNSCLTITFISYISFNSTNDVFAATFNGVFRSTNNGDTWVQTNLVESINSLAINSNGFIFAGTTNSGVYRSTDNGNTWIQINSGLINKNIRSLAISSSGYIIAGTSGGGVFRSIQSTTSVKDERNNEIPTQFVLEQNYPNPFNPSTSIQYAVGSRQFIQLKVYDVLGNEVSTLVNEEKAPGNYKVNFSVDQNDNLSSGIYFYRLQAGSFVETKKMILMR